MTVEPFPAPPPFPISGIGPYGVPFPYAEGAVRAVVRSGVLLHVLQPGTDFTVTPASAVVAGSLFLSAEAAADWDGADLILGRKTDLSQGWEGQFAREVGLEAQLDRIVQAAQEAQRAGDLAVRLDRPALAVVPVPGSVLAFDDDGQPVMGPTGDEIAAAQSHAASASASAAAAQSSAEAATGAAEDAELAADAAQAAADLLGEWRGGWETGTEYGAGDLVRQSGSVWRAAEAHLSDDFAADEAAELWDLFASQGPAGSGTGDMLAANNLSDLASTATARANLGVLHASISQSDLTLNRGMRIGQLGIGTQGSLLPVAYTANLDGLQVGGRHRLGSGVSTGGDPPFALGDDRIADVYYWDADAGAQTLVLADKDTPRIALRGRSGGDWGGWTELVSEQRLPALIEAEVGVPGWIDWEILFQDGDTPATTLTSAALEREGWEYRIRFEGVAVSSSAIFLQFFANGAWTSPVPRAHNQSSLSGMAFGTLDILGLHPARGGVAVASDLAAVGAAWGSGASNDMTQRQNAMLNYAFAGADTAAEQLRLTRTGPGSQEFTAGRIVLQRMRRVTPD